MARNNSFEPHPDQTVIADGISIKGNLTATADIWFDGTIEGNISSSGNITIADNAVVVGNLQAENILISGRVTGHIRASSKVILQTGCKVTGDIKTNSLSVTDGAQLSGNVHTAAPTIADSNEQ